jgi:hypothetical protein
MPHFLSSSDGQPTLSKSLMKISAKLLGGEQNLMVDQNLQGINLIKLFRS